MQRNYNGCIFMMVDTIIDDTFQAKIYFSFIRVLKKIKKLALTLSYSLGQET